MINKRSRGKNTAPLIMLFCYSEQSVSAVSKETEEIEEEIDKVEVERERAYCCEL